MQPQLRALLARIEQREVSELLGGVFSDLNRLLGYLDGVSAAARLGESADEALFLLGVVRSEGQATAGGLDSPPADTELPGIHNAGWPPSSAGHLPMKPATTASEPAGLTVTSIQWSPTGAAEEL